MANINLAAADASGFVPQFWANRALDVLRSKIVLLNLVARDSDFTNGGPNFSRGKTLNIPYPGTFVAQSKVTNTPVTRQTPLNGASVPLTLDNVGGANR